jgi:hypothetical protein
MGKVTWRGWYSGTDEIPEPTGPIVKRNGEAVLTINWATPERQNAFARMGDELVILPSAEHRRHVRRFTRSHLTDEQDVAIRAYAAFCVWHSRRRN